MASGPKKDRFQGFPKGWFVISFSDELIAGQMKPLRYFGQELLLYRTEDGRAVVLDGLCSHLGAHLGHGGKVEGSCVRCPFHAWLFDSSGACQEVPYGRTPPAAKADLKSWTVVEKNGAIFVWYHPDGSEPEFAVPTLPNHGSEDWLPWRHSMLRIRTHSKEIVENVVDVGHFPHVHGTHVERFENQFVDHMAIQHNAGVAYPRGGGSDRYDLTATYYGPGFQVTDMKGVLHSLLINAHTMVDEGVLDLRFGVSLRSDVSERHRDVIAQTYVDNLTTGFQEDVAIWENKRYRVHPVLCAGDGPIMRLRQWYAQFYQASWL
jgi:phenylpropionate dioxygenase-like ring-hydroxylating dioxygenase large terminal subunit